ncbi:ATP-dependent helicase [Clostridium paraputrificum]|uniref:ATP-dependent helicase n=1 Tax=Clostridium paraputrificum TaxID=29363 RepID=UPI003D33C6AD
MSYYSEKLKQISNDPLQFEAYNTKDSTAVIAGPGSGKTTILTLKIIRLLREHINEPQGLACLTFSKEASREFEERLEKLGYRKRRNVFLGTVHSFCISEILGSFAELYDYDIPLPIKVISDKEKKRIFEEVKKDLGIYNKYLKIGDMDRERTLSIKGMSGVTVESDNEILNIAKEYEKRICLAGYVDFESIIIFSTKLIQEQEYVRKCLSAKFPWIVIDEYQDLGKPLHEMILSLFTRTDIKIFAVGDPNQSIYGFSGAIPDYLMELYKRGDIISIELKNNYRSNQDIVDGSELALDIQRNCVAATRKGEQADYFFVACNKGMEDQFKYCVKKIIPYYIKQGVALEEIAVLVGKNQDAKDLAVYCMKENIPYYISKHEFKRTDFVKWLEDCAAWITDKTCVSFEKIYSYWMGLLLVHRETKFISENDSLRERKRLFDILSSSGKIKDNLKSWIKFMLLKLDVKTLLKDSKFLPDEMDNLDKLFEEASDWKYKNYDVSKFSGLGKPEKQVTLSTRHSSKGLEFEIVIMMGMEEEHFPKKYALKDLKVMEEENRMCFVCVSRAKRVCILMRSKEYEETSIYYGTYLKTYQPSRYWKLLYDKFNKNKCRK